MNDVATHNLWAANKIEIWPIERLIPNPRNSRTHSDEEIAEQARAMQEWGWTVPCLVDEHDMLLAGHRRRLAALLLGWKQASVVVARGWTDAKKRAYVIMDNRMPQNAGWDSELLAFELDELRDMNFDLNLLGFEVQELNDLIGTPNLAPAENPSDGSKTPPEGYFVLVTCTDEREQQKIFEEMGGRGYTCKVMN